MNIKHIALLFSLPVACNLYSANNRLLEKYIANYDLKQFKNLFANNQATINDTIDGKPILFSILQTSEWKKTPEEKKILLQMLEFVLEKKAAVDELFKGSTPLHTAIQNNNTAAAALLINHGAPLEVRDSDNRTPLLAAVIASSPEIINLLLTHGADIDAVDSDGQTSLHLSVFFNDPTTAETLLKSGANTSIKDNKGETAYESLLNPNLWPRLNRNLIKQIFDKYRMGSGLKNILERDKEKKSSDVTFKHK